VSIVLHSTQSLSCKKYLRNKKKNEIYHLASWIKECGNISQSSKECPRDPVKLRKVLCGSLEQVKNSGKIVVSGLPEKSLCFWRFELKGKNGSSQFTLESSDPAIIIITDSSINTTKTYEINENSHLEMNFQVKTLNLVAYSESKTISSLSLSWESSSTSKLSKSTLMMILAITSSFTVMILMLVFFFIYLKKKRKSSRVSLESRYNYIPQDSSFTNFLDSLIPLRFLTDPVEDPCCICFDK
jgi:hypothetical protein